LTYDLSQPARRGRPRWRRFAPRRRTARRGRSGRPAVGPRALAAFVTTAETGGFTSVTFDDAPLPPNGGLRLDATTRAAYVATLTDRLVPELQDRGVYRTEYDGTTLREHLDLA